MSVVAFLGFQWPQDATDLLQVTVKDVQAWHDTMFEQHYWSLHPEVKNIRIGDG